MANILERRPMLHNASKISRHVVSQLNFLALIKASGYCNSTCNVYYNGRRYQGGESFQWFIESFWWYCNNSTSLWLRRLVKGEQSVFKLEKTYEIVVRGKVFAPLPDQIPSIIRKEWHKLFGVTMEEIPGKWDKHFEEMMKKASRKMYILRICKHYGLSSHQLDLLINSLIVSLFTFTAEVIWGRTSYNIRLISSSIVPIEMVTRATDQILKQ